MPVLIPAVVDDEIQLHIFRKDPEGKVMGFNAEIRIFDKEGEAYAFLAEKDEEWLKSHLTRIIHVFLHRYRK